jgi:ABC-type polysaccharide/polyol phosphate export permease
VGLVQGGIVLACAPFLVPVTPARLGAGLGALVLAAASSALLGLLVASRLRSVENFAGVINVVLFPLLFVSGALYPTTGMPPALRLLAGVNPVTYQVDLMRHAFGQAAEFAVGRDVLLLLGTIAVAFGLTVLLFDPEQRFLGRADGGPRGPVGRPGGEVGPADGAAARASGPAPTRPPARGAIGTAA